MRQTWGQAKPLGHPQKTRSEKTSSSFGHINPSEKEQAGKQGWGGESVGILEAWDKVWRLRVPGRRI